MERAPAALGVVVAVSTSAAGDLAQGSRRRNTARPQTATISAARAGRGCLEAHELDHRGGDVLALLRTEVTTGVDVALDGAADREFGELPGRASRRLLELVHEGAHNVSLRS